MRGPRQIPIVLLGLATLAGGCRVDQAKEVDAWRSVLTSEKTPPTYAAGQSLSLLDALRLANWRNERLAISGEDYLQVRIDVARAVAAFLPTLTFGASWMHEQRLADPAISAFAPNRAKDWSFEGAMDVNVPRGLAGVGLAVSAVDRQRELLLDAQASLWLNVAQTYYAVLASEAEVDFLEHSVTVQEAGLSQVEVRRRAGTATPADVAQARAQLADTRVSLIRARNGVHNGRALLALLTGVHAVEGPLSDELQPLAEPRQTPSGSGAPMSGPPAADELLKLADENRHDLAAAAHQVGEARANLARAWSRYFPSVTFDGSWFTHRETFPSQVRWMHTLGLNIPIFSAGLIHADVRTAYSMLRQADLYLAWVRRQVLEQIRTALWDYEDARSRERQLTVERDAASDALRRAEVAWKAGAATRLQVLVARDQYLKAGAALVRERLAKKIDYLALMRAVGRLNLQSVQSGRLDGQS